MAQRLARLILTGVLVAAASGCRDAKVTAYRIPKEPAPAEAAAARQEGAAITGATVPGVGPMTGSVPTAAGMALTWQAPAAWTAKPATATRKGSYQVGADGDMSITAFGGDAGGELANLNRWRGQVQLPAVATVETGNGVTKTEHDGLKFTVVDFAGGGQRILGAIVPVGSDTWFIKLSGPEATIAAAKPAFSEFLQSVKPSGSGAGGTGK